MLMFTTELFNLIHLFFLQPGTKQKVAACKEQGAADLSTWSRKFKLLWSSAACFHLDCIQCIFHTVQSIRIYIMYVYIYTYGVHRVLYIPGGAGFLHQQNVLAERVFSGSAGLCGLRTQLFLFKANGAVAVHIVNRVSWCFMHAKCKENLVSQKSKATTSLIRTLTYILVCCLSYFAVLPGFLPTKTQVVESKKGNQPTAPPTKFPPNLARWHSRPLGHEVMVVLCWKLEEQWKKVPF